MAHITKDDNPGILKNGDLESQGNSDLNNEMYYQMWQ